MFQNKLIHSLSALSRKEMTRFLSFVESPYFNKHEGVRLLVHYLNKIYPDFKEKNCDREVLFQQLFPNQRHNQQQLAVVFTYTQRLLELFFSIESFNGRQTLQDLLLLDALRQHQLYDYYSKILKRSEKCLENTPIKDGKFYEWKYRLAAEADLFYQQSGKRQKDRSIEQKQLNLDRLFMVEKLRDACEMLERNRILKIRLKPKLIEPVLEEIRLSLDAYKGDPPLYVYFMLYQMLAHRQTEDYHEALGIWLENMTAFSPMEQRHIFNYFQNFCIAQINNGQASFLKEVFRLYILQLEQGLLIEDGYLSEWHYKNIVTTGIRLDELVWVRDFIESYKERLHPESRSNAYRFNLASYYYANKQYGEVLGLLTKVEYSDLRYNLGAKALLLRTYYDLGEYDALHSLTESFRQYLYRNKLMADSRRVAYYNLFKLTRKALAIQINAPLVNATKNKREVLKLEQEIDQAKGIFNKSWLLEKVTELKDSVSI